MHTSFIRAVAARPGWRRAYGDPTHDGLAVWLSESLINDDAFNDDPEGSPR